MNATENLLTAANLILISNFCAMETSVVCPLEDSRRLKGPIVMIYLATHWAVNIISCELGQFNMALNED